MKNNTLRKMLVTGLIILFIWASTLSGGSEETILEQANTTIIYVPDDYPTIQEAIDASSDHDKVVIADGIYTGSGNKNINFSGKAIIVRSENGPESCIVDAEYDGRGFMFTSGETHQSILQGITIRNGYVDESYSYGKKGGGIICYESSPTITNCIIKNNTVTADMFPRGGGLYCYDGSPKIRNCIVEGNTNMGETYGGDGAGFNLHGYECFATVINCVFRNNNQYGEYGQGGGISCDASDVKIKYCLFLNNSAYSGGGISFWMNNPIMSHCKFKGNSAYLKGGAIRCTYGSLPTINNCKITENNVQQYGGGIACTGAKTQLKNCLINNNTAGKYGGGIYTFHEMGNPTLINGCTIADNIANETGSGVYVGGNGHNPTISNCIIWDNYGQQIGVWAGCLPIFRYSDIQNGWPGIGNIDLDPMFVGGRDYHLQLGSPCIDTGDPGFVPQPGETDIDGDLRILDGDNDGQPIIDMGADENRYRLYDSIN